MLNALLLSLIEEAGASVLTLMGSLNQKELLRSRLTRSEVNRQVLSMADFAARLPSETRTLMTALDWEAWELTAKLLKQTGPDADDALWFAVSSLVPATLLWLRHYRKTEPEVFSWTPESLRNLGEHEP